MIDLTEPKGPMSLSDWVARYPDLPLRTISLCLWEAETTARAHLTDADHNIVVAWLVSERLDELRLATAR